MARPDCDGRYITIVGNSVSPGLYAQEISALLAAHPGSQYLRTDQTCPSLRQEDEQGNAIYSVFYGPFATEPEACDARSRGADGTVPYARVLSRTTPSSHRINCS